MPKNKVMYKKVFVLILLQFLVFSCKQEELRLKDNTEGIPTSLIVKKESIVVDDQCLLDYTMLSTYKSPENESGFIYGYNYKTHSLDILDTWTRKISHIALQSDGPHAILLQIQGLYVYNEDSIWVYNQGTIYLINNEGEVQEKIVVSDLKEGFVITDTNYSIAANKLYYNKKRKSLFYTVRSTREDPLFFVYEYCLENGQISKNEIQGVGFEKDIKSYGWKQLPNVTFTDEKIIYNFPFESNIYTVDIETGKKQAFGGKSKFTDNVVSHISGSFSFEMAERHKVENIHFFEILYNSAKNVYYRLHVGKSEFIDGEDIFKLYNRKKMYIMVFDSNFNIINETELMPNKYYYINNWGMMSDGLFIASIPADENKYEYDIFSIQE